MSKYFTKQKVTVILVILLIIIAMCEYHYINKFIENKCTYETFIADEDVSMIATKEKYN